MDLFYSALSNINLIKFYFGDYRPHDKLIYNE